MDTVELDVLEVNEDDGDNELDGDDELDVADELGEDGEGR